MFTAVIQIITKSTQPDAQLWLLVTCSHAGTAHQSHSTLPVYTATAITSRIHPPNVNTRQVQ